MANPGSVRLTGDSNISAGRPTRVYTVNWVSGGTAGILQLRNGTADTDDLYYESDGIINQGDTITFEGGLYFPDGLFYDHDANTVQATISYTLNG
jgi:hypothetical protein